MFSPVKADRKPPNQGVILCYNFYGSFEMNPFDQCFRQSNMLENLPHKGLFYVDIEIFITYTQLEIKLLRKLLLLALLAGFPSHYDSL